VLTFELCLIQGLSERLAVAFAILFLDELLLGRGLGSWSKYCCLARVVHYDAGINVGATDNV
jgi:hypothetical protein